MQRVRVVFTKDEPVRFIGHLDLVRMWERAFRRARLPLAYTLGFTPHLRLTFAAPLALGATSAGELVDVYLRERVAPDDLLRGVAAQLPNGCSVVRAWDVPLDGPSLSALTRWAEYEVEATAAPEPPDDVAVAPARPQGSRWAGQTAAPREPPGPDTHDAPWRPPSERWAPPEPAPPLPPREELRRRVAALGAAETLPRVRTRDGSRVTYDLRPLVKALWLVDASSDVGRVRVGIVVRLDSSGAGRPDEVCAALGLRAMVVRRLRIGLDGEPEARSPDLP